MRAEDPGLAHTISGQGYDRSLCRGTYCVEFFRNRRSRPNRVEGWLETPHAKPHQDVPAARTERPATPVWITFSRGSHSEPAVIAGARERRSSGRVGRFFGNREWRSAELPASSLESRVEEKMSSRETGRGICGGLVKPLLLAAIVVSACEGEYRPYDPTQTTNSNQPAANGATPTAPTVSAAPSNEGQAIGLPNLSPNESADGTALDDGCASAGTCPPVPLCDGDAGTCEATCPGCFIDGECVAAAALQPENPCRICDPTRDPRAWSSNDGANCDDQLYCTVDDACRAGSCTGTARNCDDGVACNGIATCNEDADACSAPVNQCGNNAVCNVATDTCDSTCNGCVVAGVCVLAGTEAPGNPCQVCDPARSATAYTVVAGKSCGAPATACSAQDTCDAQGRCQPNHLPAGTACGNPNSNACDPSDACDGSGNCQQRIAANGTPCDDGAFCTTGDQCQGGQCVASGQVNCGANRTCNEAADQCQCQGCQIGATCFANGARNPNDSCQVCDTNRSRAVFSVNAGAACGSAPTSCSGQDTCDAQGRCQPNDLPASSACGAGQVCDGNGSCFTPQCTGVGQCGDCRTCSNFRCVGVAQGAPCSNSRVCTAAGQCVQCIGAAQCGAGQTCNSATNSCVSACQPTTEICDGRDNDCDGQVDEGFSFQSDAINCGGCGVQCLGASCVNSRCTCSNEVLVYTPDRGCVLRAGEVCTTAGDCASNVCTPSSQPGPPGFCG